MTPPPPGEDLYERVYRTSGTAILGYALRRCATREDAFDVAAETFATAWRRREHLPDDLDEARAWLFAIARNCLANAMRGQERASRLGDRLADFFSPEAIPDPAVVFEQSGQVQLMRGALSSLTADDQELLTLTAWEGLTATQAATVLGIATGTARVRLHRARARLRTALHAARAVEEIDHDH